MAEVEKKPLMPWEENYTLKPRQALVEPPKPLPDHSVGPWGLKWDVKSLDTKTKVPAPPIGVKRNKDEQKMAEAVALTPAEEIQREIDMISDQSLSEIQQELSRKDLHPLAKNILTEELNRMLEKRKKK